MELSTQPLKGFADWLPEEFKIRKYIFDTYRRVCARFGYQEYLTPMLEDAEIYRAKSGDEVGGKELYMVRDRAGRELAIRPEMTPSVTRLVASIYQATPKPIKLFSIANFLRNQKPQRGRNREFWQLNYDIFGSESINSDVEIIQIALEVMLAFAPPEGSFTIYINNRKLIDEILMKRADVRENSRVEVVRLLDKAEKIGQDELKKQLQKIGINQDTVQALLKFAQSKDKKTLAGNFSDIEQTEGFKETVKIMGSLQNMGYGDWIEFNPSVIRGFDYYDGMVFEVFDNNPKNNRSLFGGGRYNGLAGIFGSDPFPAVGCAPGDETMRLFLEAWDLIPENLESPTVYVTVFDEEAREYSQKVADEFRSLGINASVSFDSDKLGSQIGFADRMGYRYVIIAGPDEIEKGKVQLKDLISGKEVDMSVEKAGEIVASS
ncbi:histidine--tRNA ligase [Candidatus Dojkabacteria bacterium]|nr:histidine--tRNA ligase [Candidatus Dojkabacteria bacterium]